MELAPIAFFAYKRPAHTLAALQALSACGLARESLLHIFCDGPKSPAEDQQVAQVREVAARCRWCGQVEIITREKNLGLANSIMAGVSALCQQYGRAIVLEDDLAVAPHFLSYMNEALERYQEAPQVMQVSGYMFPLEMAPTADAFFLPLTTTWGWGTWQRAWRHFDAGMSGYRHLQENPQLRHTFDLQGAYPYFAMLEQLREGKVDSWGIRWYLTTFRLGGLTLYPRRSLVHNMGFDASGTHCEAGSGFSTPSWPGKVEHWPEVQPDDEVFRQVRQFLQEQSRAGRGRLRRCLNSLKSGFFSG